MRRNHNKNQRDKPTIPHAHFGGRAKKAITTKYFDCETPPMCMPSTLDHPVYFRKTNLGCEREPQALEEYRRIVSQFISHWRREKKGFECVCVVLRQIYFMERDPCMKTVADLLKQLLSEGFRVPKSETITPIRFRTLPCELEDTGMCFDITLPSNMPLKDLDELFLAARNTNTLKSSTWKSSKQMTILLEHTLASSTSSDHEQEDPPESPETLVVNDASKSIEELAAEHPGYTMKFYLKKESAIERRIYFGADGYKATINRLASIIERENWGSGNWMLRNFVNETVIRQLKEGHVVTHQINGKTFYGCHLNLLRKEGCPAVILLRKYDEFPHPPEFEFIDFLTVRSSEIQEIERKFLRPTWMESGYVFFDKNLEVECNYVHVFNTNESRITNCYSNAGTSGRIMDENIPTSAAICDWFTGQMSKQLQHATYSPTLAIPQIFNENEVQLLLPLYKDSVVALVITLARKQRKDGTFYYQVHTILEPIWAYNNARVLGPIESKWLESSLKIADSGNSSSSEEELLSEC